MKTATLTLFDLGALNPDQPRICGWCKNKPATTRVYAIQNLYGVHRILGASNAYRHAFRRAHSGPCCNACARYLAGAWWGPTYACTGRAVCHLWGHTLAEPRPAWNCGGCHRESTVVWMVPLEVTAR